MNALRARLREADALLRVGRVAEAAVAYNHVADDLEQAGFAVKAVAVSRQVVDIARELPAIRHAALARLVRLYEVLDLCADAARVRRVLGAERAS